MISPHVLDSWPLYDRCDEGYCASREAKRELSLNSAIGKIPITRVTDITSLDVLGIPVFAAVTPLAKDLTTHLGKGTNKETARIGALMEAVERVSAEEFESKPRIASYVELAVSDARVADPLSFDIPPETTYRPESLFEWVEGWELMNAHPIWILADLARSPAKEGILGQVDTNGLAAGFTHGQAVRNAILEIVERDSVSQCQFFKQYGDEGDTGPIGRRIDLESLPAKPKALVERARNANLELVLEDLTTDLEIAVISCTLIDPSFCGTNGPMPLTFVGWGADLVAETAVTHAILESYQSRLGVIHGARDSYNQIPPHPRRTERRFQDSSTRHHFSTIANTKLPDLAAEIDFILKRLKGVGVTQTIIVDMTRKSLGLPVVRVRIPGLSLFSIDRHRIGWRSARHLL
ncbi:ribosomal protein S12 methylthiotransferase accessory factor [Rhizobium sp. BK313]|uniref:YcaO-like family protein n=1 Tax=Rhizobium sp. BK313 TaxID=2587081 RepID=UPI0010D914B3|nr:YcaO-like family protein [Rhizobium sp. BK313]MBB3457342.1 ribosomal protein S12 methylthiotransferase accessory factor [Rhizobium sp. BK313]